MDDEPVIGGGEEEGETGVVEGTVLDQETHSSENIAIDAESDLTEGDNGQERLLPPPRPTIRSFYTLEFLKWSPSTIVSELCPQWLQTKKVKDTWEVFGALFNYVNGTIGIGILFLPGVLNDVGLIPGLLLMVIFAAIEAVTLYLLYLSFKKLNEKKLRTEEDESEDESDHSIDQPPKDLEMSELTPQPKLPTDNSIASRDDHLDPRPITPIEEDDIEDPPPGTEISDTMNGSINMNLISRHPKPEPEYNDYEQVGAHIFGHSKLIRFIIQFCVFFLCFGTCISYCIVISHSLSSFMSPTLASICTIILMLPTSCISMLRKIAALKWTGICTFVLYILFCILVVISFFVSLLPHVATRKGNINFISIFGTKKKEASFGTKMLGKCSVLGIVLFAYSCHTLAFPVLSQCESARSTRLVGRYVSFLNFFVVWIFYVLVSVFGYLCFYENTETDILFSFGKYFGGRMGGGWVGSVLSWCMRLLILVTVVGSWPLAAYVARYTLNNMWRDVGGYLLYCCFGKRKPFWESSSPLKEEEEEEEVLSIGEKKKGKKWLCFDFVLTVVNTTFITIVSLAFAIFYPKAADVFGLIGSTGGIMTTFLLPGLFYLKLHWKENSCWKRTVVIGVTAFGVISGILVVIADIVRAITKS